MWWCPLPSPPKGEELDHHKYCDHASFGAMEDVRVHFLREHWDFGEWKGACRDVRSFGRNKIDCPKKCGAKFFRLREMDAHILDSSNTRNEPLHLIQVKQIVIPPPTMCNLFPLFFRLFLMLRFDVCLSYVQATPTNPKKPPKQKQRPPEAA